MSFFDTTPSGRILNRFSQDMDEVDVRLPFSLEQFLQNVILIIITLGLIAVVVPWFLIGLVFITAFFFAFVTYFGPAQRQVKRLDNGALVVFFLLLAQFFCNSSKKILFNSGSLAVVLAFDCDTARARHNSRVWTWRHVSANVL